MNFGNIIVQGITIVKLTGDKSNSLVTSQLDYVRGMWADLYLDCGFYEYLFFANK